MRIEAACLHNKVLSSNENEPITFSHDNMGEFHDHNVWQKEYMLHDSIYIKHKSR